MHLFEIQPPGGATLSHCHITWDFTIDSQYWLRMFINQSHISKVSTRSSTRVINKGHKLGSSIRCLQLWCQPMGPLCLWQCYFLILSTFSKHTDDPSRNRCMTRDCRGREDLIKWFRFGKNLSFKPNIKWPRITGICNQFIRLGDFVEISDISETAPPIIATQFRKLLPLK